MISVGIELLYNVFFGFAFFACNGTAKVVLFFINQDSVITISRANSFVRRKLTLCATFMVGLVAAFMCKAVIKTAQAPELRH